MTNPNESMQSDAAAQDSIESRVTSLFLSLLPEQNLNEQNLNEQGLNGQGNNDCAQMDFFALGGNSMLAARLVVKLRHEFKVNVSIRDVFRGRTVGAISQAVRDGCEG